MIYLLSININIITTIIIICLKLYIFKYHDESDTGLIHNNCKILKNNSPK